MSVHPPEVRPWATRPRTVLDVAVEALAANPSASLGEIAAAAGIGRTTLHKQYATRQDLLEAVALHCLRRIEDGVRVALDALPAEPAGPAEVSVPAEAVAGPAEAAQLEVERALLVLVRELVPLGGGIAFLVRQPTLDHAGGIQGRLDGLEPMIARLVREGKRYGALRADLADWWYVQTLFAQLYVAWEAVASGRLAAVDAPGLVTSTLVDGLGSPCRPE